jgi:hypothetical protein
VTTTGSGGSAREGEECYREVISLYEQHSERNHPFTALLRIDLSMALLSRNRRREAEQVASEALDGALWIVRGRSRLQDGGNCGLAFAPQKFIARQKC